MQKKLQDRAEIGTPISQLNKFKQVHSPDRKKKPDSFDNL